MKLALACLNLVLLLIAGSPATAQEAAQCSQKSRDQAGKCDTAVKQQEAAGNMRGIAASNASGTDINSNSKTLGNQTAQMISGIDSAIAACEAAKSSCKGDCAQLQGQAAKKFPNGAMEASQVQTNEQKECSGKIDEKLAKLNGAKSALQGDQAAAKDSEGGSAGGMPPMPPPKENETPEDTVIVKKCGEENLHNKVECDSHFLHKCDINQNDYGCKEFADRYCQLGSKVGPDVGKGKGSAYCQKAIANNYCIAGREACLTCQNYTAVKAGYPVSNTPEQIEAARLPLACNEDPLVFNGITTTSTVADTPTVDAPVALGAGISTGYSSSSVSAQSAGDRIGNGLSSAAAASVPGYSPNSILGSDGSAAPSDLSSAGVSATGAKGYKASSVNGKGEGAMAEGVNSLAASIADQATNDVFNDRISGNGDLAARGPGSFEPTEVADVATQFGGTLFNISSSTIRSMCDQRRLNCRLHAH